MKDVEQAFETLCAFRTPCELHLRPPIMRKRNDVEVNLALLQMATWAGLTQLV